MNTSVYKRTSDDWYPSYTLTQRVRSGEPLKLVEVKFTQTGPDPKSGNGEWRVCVWGGDDCGMERDFADENEARAIFHEVIYLDDVTMAALRKYGFVSA